MARQRIRRRPMSDINVVPYIDVMLVMLVIFMITAPLLTQGVHVQLPQASAKPLPSKQQEPLLVTVGPRGRFYLNIGEHPRDPVDADTLVQRTAAVLRLHPDTQVLVKGDRRVPYGDVVTAMALLQRAGASGVGLVTENPRMNR